MTWASAEERVLRLCDLVLPSSRAGEALAGEALRCCWQVLGQIRHLSRHLPAPSEETVAILEQSLGAIEACCRVEGVAVPAPPVVNGPRGVA